MLPSISKRNQWPIERLTIQSQSCGNNFKVFQNTETCLSCGLVIKFSDNEDGLLFHLLGWSGTNSTITEDTYWPTVPALEDGDCGAIGGINDWDGKPKYLKKTCSSATVSTRDPTWPDPGSNPGHCSGKPEINCLSYGMAMGGSLLKQKHAR
jgi:hypothetical protein